MKASAPDGHHPACEARRTAVFFNGARGAGVLARLKAEGRKVIAAVVPKSRADDEMLNAAAALHGLTPLAAASVNSAETVLRLRALEPDVFIIAGYSEIFRKELIAVPEVLAMNLHAGPLPGCRGGSPLNWQIIDGEARLGLSIIRIDAGIDTGPVLARADFEFGRREDIAAAHVRANALFADMTAGVLDRLAAGELRETPQPETGARHRRQRRPEDGRINPETMTGEEVFNLVRAVTRPYPGAFLDTPEGRLKVWRAEPCAPGETGAKNAASAGDVLACAGGSAVRLLETERPPRAVARPRARTADAARPPARAVSAVIFARMDSARLPGKALADLGGRPVLSRVLGRVRLAGLGGEPVIATSARAVDDEIARFAEHAGAQVFRGAADDVLGRAAACAREYNLGALVRISGDSPFIDPALIRRAVDAWLAQPDLELVTNLCPRTFPPGVSVEVISRALLDRLDAEVTDAALREHVTRAVYDRPDDFRLHNIAAEGAARAAGAGLDLAVDDAAGLARARGIINALGPDAETAPLAEVLKAAGGGAHKKPSS